MDIVLTRKEGLTPIQAFIKKKVQSSKKIQFLTRILHRIITVFIKISVL